MNAGYTIHNRYSMFVWYERKRQVIVCTNIRALVGTLSEIKWRTQDRNYFYMRTSHSLVSASNAWSLFIRAGTIQKLSVHYRYRNQPIRIDTIIMLYWYRWWWQPHPLPAQKTTTILDPKLNLFVSHLPFIQLSKTL